MSSNNVGHLFSKTITTLQHFATLHHTSPNYNSLHLSTLRFLLFILHYPLIWLNPYTSTFPIILFHLTSLNQTQYSSHLQTYFQNNEPLHCPKEPLTISLHFTFYFFHLYYQPFTSLHFTLLFISTTHFTFYHLHFPSLIFTFLTLVLKICILPWEVPFTPSGSLFQSVMVLFTKEYFPRSVFLFSGSDFPILIDPT